MNQKELKSWQEMKLAAKIVREGDRMKTIVWSLSVILLKVWYEKVKEQNYPLQVFLEGRHHA